MAAETLLIRSMIAKSHSEAWCLLVQAALLQAQAELSAKEQVLSSWLPHWAAVKINPLQVTRVQMLL
jgi:hypothetical protein